MRGGESCTLRLLSPRTPRTGTICFAANPASGSFAGPIEVFLDVAGNIGMTLVQELPQLAIVTALPKEHAAARRLLTEAGSVHIEGDPTLYTVGWIEGPNGSHRVVLACLSKYANNPAAVTSTNLLRSFPSVTDIILVGIAAGIPRPHKPDEHIRLGDVIVSSGSGVIQFDLGARRPTHFEIRDTSPPPSARLLQAVNKLESEILTGGFSWLDYSFKFFQDAGVERPKKEPRKAFKHPYDRTRIKGLPKIFRGKIGASNSLMKSSDHRDEIAEQLGILAIEMEGSGVADATWEAQAGYLLVRSACDYADENKDDSWHEYATHAATAYLGALLRQLPAFLPNRHEAKRKRLPAEEIAVSRSTEEYFGASKQPLRIHASGGRLTSCIWINDSSSIAAAGFAGKIYIGDATAGKISNDVRVGDAIVRCLIQIPNEATLLIGDDLGRILSFDLSNGAVTELASAKTTVFALDYCPSNHLLYSADRNGCVVEWNYQSSSAQARRLRIVHRHRGPAFAVRYDHYTQTVWSAGADGQMRATRLDGGEQYTQNVSPASLFCFARVRDKLVVGDSAGLLFVQDAEKRELMSVEGHLDAVRGVALTETGAWAATSSKDGTLRLWHLRSNRSWIVAESRDYLYDVCFSVCGKHLVACDGSGDLLIVGFEKRLDDLSPQALDKWCEQQAVSL